MSFIDLIRKERGLLCQMKETLEKENNALVNDDTASLNEIVNVKENLNNSIQEIEKKRTGLFGSLSLSEASQSLKREEKDEEADEVDAIGLDMREVVSDIKRLNDTNSLLVRMSLSYVNSMMNILSPEKNRVYNNSGEINGDTQKNNMFDISI